MHTSHAIRTDVFSPPSQPHPTSSTPLDPCPNHPPQASVTVPVGESRGQQLSSIVIFTLTTTHVVAAS